MKFCLLREHFIGEEKHLWICCFLGSFFFTFLFLLVWLLLFLLPSLLKSVSLQDKRCLVKEMFSLNSAGVLLLQSELPGVQRRVLICTHISRQSSRTSYRSRSSTSDICSGNAPPPCPCRGCSLCHSTSSRSCHSHWKSCCIAWKKEKAVSKCKFLLGFPDRCCVVLLGLTALQGTGGSQHSQHPQPLCLQGCQGKPWAATTC